LGGFEGETGNIGKRLGLRNQDETQWVEEANVVDTYTDNCAEFGASGRARTMKIGRRVRELHKLT